MSKTTVYLLVALLLLLLGGGGYYFFKVRPANEVPETAELAQPSDALPDAGSGAANATPGAGAGGEGGDPATPGAGAGTADPNAAGGAGGAGAGGGTPGAETPDAGAGAGTPGAAGAGAAGSSVNVFAAGSFSGNTSYGVKIASKVGSLATKRNLTFAVDVQLLPAAGGRVTKRPDIRKYQQTVTGAAMRLEADDQTLAEWNRASKPARRTIVVNFLGLLKTEFPRANTSVTIVGPDDRVLAIGDRSSSGDLVVKLG